MITTRPASMLMEAALAYADRGWVLFPAVDKSRPLVKWRDAATTDPRIIEGWWRRWPTAAIGLPTGRNFVVLDVDTKVDQAGRSGFDTLAALMPDRPRTPSVTTRSGGEHLYFAAPATQLRNTAGQYGRGIGFACDWRGAGGYVLAAPSPGYSWKPGCGIADAPLAPVPQALMPRERVVERPAAGAASAAGYWRAAVQDSSGYFRGALEITSRRIREAPAGVQEATLNREAYSLGTLVAAGAGPELVARRVLMAAASSVPTLDPSRPWRPGESEAKALRAFDAGLQHPRLRAPALRVRVR